MNFLRLRVSKKGRVHEPPFQQPRLMSDLKSIGEDLSSCFGHLADVKAEISLQDDRTIVTEELPWQKEASQSK